MDSAHHDNNCSSYILHPLLQNLNLSTFEQIISSEEDAIQLFRDFGLLPPNEWTPMCDCGHKMSKTNDKKRKLGYIWRCWTGCQKKTISPTQTTFFERTKLTFREVLLLLLIFVRRDKAQYVSLDDMNDRRRLQGLKTMSNNTFIQYQNAFRSICETVACNDFYTVIGGKNMTIEMDETYTTRRKYNRGRVTDNMKLTIFGLLCREQKRTLFFLVEGSKKKHLWPIIQRYCHPDTTFICTDGHKSYVEVETLFKNAQHKVVIHKERFRDIHDIHNHINGLEVDNRWLKKDISSRRGNEVIKSHQESLHWDIIVNH